MLNKLKEFKKNIVIGYRVFNNPVFKSELKLAFSDINRANKERRQALKELKEACKKEEQNIEVLHTEKVQKALIRFISLTGGVIKQEELTMKLEGDKTALVTVFD